VKGNRGYRVGLVATDSASIEPGTNVAAEPADDVVLHSHKLEALGAAPKSDGDDRLLHLGALSRAVLIAAALERVLGMTIEYSRQRQQFGRPLSRFQAVQQSLALLAAETVSARAAVDSAVGGATLAGNSYDVAVAKIRTGVAAGRGAALAHQIHGAIGMTLEHTLHHWTTRLWAWRDEYGGEAYWSERLGRSISRDSRRTLWEQIVEH
jgi:alkylation response protein AidB-like acyl-CoA dehydrogenase